MEWNAGVSPFMMHLLTGLCMLKIGSGYALEKVLITGGRGENPPENPSNNIPPLLSMCFKIDYEQGYGM